MDNIRRSLPFYHSWELKGYRPQYRSFTEVDLNLSIVMLNQKVASKQPIIINTAGQHLSACRKIWDEPRRDLPGVWHYFPWQASPQLALFKASYFPARKKQLYWNSQAKPKGSSGNISTVHCTSKMTPQKLL